MAQLLLIDDDPGALFAWGMSLRLAGHTVLTASSGRQGLALLTQQPVDLVLSDLRLPDMSGLEVLRSLRCWDASLPFVVVTGFASTRDAVGAMQLGASDFLEKPLLEEMLLQSVETALARKSAGSPDEPLRPAFRDPAIEGFPLADRNADRKADLNADRGADRPPDEAAPHEPVTQEAHAAARWARVVVPVLDAPQDPRTITAWSRHVFVSPGALRNWCRMAGISPRRSLVFARLLRAVCLGHGGRHKPENLLDVVDRRTLIGLLRFAGLNTQSEFPSDPDTFLERQELVRDPDALAEIRRALAARHSPPLRVASGGKTG